MEGSGLTDAPGPTENCPPGAFLPTVPNGLCIACAPGRFGGSTTPTSFFCSGQCFGRGGLVCPRAHTSPDGIYCPSGSLSANGASCGSFDDVAPLVHLYHTLGGPGWSVSTNWLSGAPCEPKTWHGVTCTTVAVVDSDGNLVEALPRVTYVRGWRREGMAESEGVHKISVFHAMSCCLSTFTACSQADVVRFPADLLSENVVLPCSLGFAILYQAYCHRLIRFRQACQPYGQRPCWESYAAVSGDPFPRVCV